MTGVASALRRAPGRAALWIAVPCLLALALRLWFTLSFSTIFPVWDTAGYWQYTKEMHDGFCRVVPWCEPAGAVSGAGWHRIVSLLILDKSGLLPLLLGLATTVLPLQPMTGYVLLAGMDAAACLMIAHVALRLGLPLWSACLAALLQAVHVPSIVQTGALLQQPLIRFTLTFALWAATLALTDRNRGWRAVALCTLASVMTGFASVATRPLMWLVPSALIVAAGTGGRSRRVAGMQIAALAILVLIVVVTSLTLAAAVPQTGAREWLMHEAFGLSTKGVSEGQLTPVSFANAWAPDAWNLHGMSATETIAGDFQRGPGTFLHAWLFSIYENWRYPDYLYFQHFGLSRVGLLLQHLAYLSLGVVGIAWLAGRRGARRQVAFLLAVIVGYCSVVYGLISVEPRRLVVLTPMLSLGAACAVFSLSRRAALASTVLWAGAGAIALPALWLVPIAPLVAIGASPMFAHALQVAWRSIAVLSLALALMAAWRNWEPGFRRLPAAAPLAIALAVLTFGLWNDEKWREWSLRTTQVLHQEATGIRLAPGLHPWLLVDAASAEALAEAEIDFNAHTIKPPGVPLRRWQVEQPSPWGPYESPYVTLAKMRRLDVGQALWLAIPVPAPLVTATGHNRIDIAPRGQPIDILGDYIDGDAYQGPSWTPWLTGLSLWRWIWDARDPRISMPQPLGDVRYTSGVPDGPLSATFPASAIVRGRAVYRIFVTQEAFGEPTNALTPAGGAPPDLATCREHALSPLRACRAADGSVHYQSSAGQSLGATAAARFAVDPGERATIDVVESSAGRVELIRVLDGIYVANLYGRGGYLDWSVAFENRQLSTRPTSKPRARARAAREGVVWCSACRAWFPVEDELLDLLLGESAS